MDYSSGSAFQGRGNGTCCREPRALLYFTGKQRRCCIDIVFIVGCIICLKFGFFQLVGFVICGIVGLGVIIQLVFECLQLVSYDGASTAVIADA
jgi:hypothetical protein